MSTQLGPIKRASSYHQHKAEYIKQIYTIPGVKTNKNRIMDNVQKANCAGKDV
jgi:hypothetical protein